MKKIILISLMLLSGCTSFMNNPYASLPDESIRNLSDFDLCRVVVDRRYKIDPRVTSEASRRGYVDCSSSELYCKAKLGLKYGTQQYANCMLTYRQQQTMSDIADRPVQYNVNHTYNQRSPAIDSFMNGYNGY